MLGTVGGVCYGAVWYGMPSFGVVWYGMVRRWGFGVWGLVLSVKAPGDGCWLVDIGAFGRGIPGSWKRVWGGWRMDWEGRCGEGWIGGRGFLGGGWMEFGSWSWVCWKVGCCRDVFVLYLMMLLVDESMLARSLGGLGIGGF